MLITDVAWREKYASAALNRKFSGITAPGIYKGFNLIPVNGQFFAIDTADSAAVIDRDGYSITVRGDGQAEQIEAPAGVVCYVVIEAFYAINEPTRAQIKVVTEMEPHHCLIGVIDSVDGTAEIVPTTRSHKKIGILDLGEL